MNALEKLRNGIRFVGAAGVLRALHYTWWRDRTARRFSPPAPARGWSEPGPLQSVEATDRGARWHFARTELELSFLAPDLVRCQWCEGIPPLPYARTDREWPPVATQLHEQAGGWLLRSQDLSIHVGAAGGLTYADAAGAVLREEFPPVYREGAWRQRAVLRPEERLYGLGERAASLDLRGGVYRMWNRDPGGSYETGDDPLYLCIPVYLSLHRAGSHLIFYENSFDAHFDLGASDPAAIRICLDGGRLCTYVAVGSPARLLARYAELTGHAPLPPRWALGYQQSRWGYSSSAEVRAIASGFQRHGLPLQAICLDLDYMDGRRVFTVDSARFPDLERLACELAARDVRLVTILDPGVKRDPAYPVYREGMSQGCFCKLPDDRIVAAPVWPGTCVFPDFSDPEVRVWWGQHYPRLLDAGVAGFWHDMNEPAVFAAWGDGSLPLATQHNCDGREGDHREIHNLYGLLQASAAHTALRTQRPHQRPFLISRSGWAGLQRYAWTWTGDTASTWQALHQTIATVLGLGLSGIPYAGPDIGGFSGTPSPELYLRWFQMATFLPLFRTHSALHTPRREPWVFGEPYLSILRSYLNLRAQILPYLYTLCWETKRTGAPLVRPLFWCDTDDEDLWAVDDQFLLGDDLLVAPVVTAGATARRVTFSKGTWYDFWDDTPYIGPDVFSCAAPLERIPLFVRGGSVLPQTAGNRLVLHVYPPHAGRDRGRLYSDAGDGYGAWRLDTFTQTRSGETLSLAWQTTGDYPFPYNAVDLHLHGSLAGHITVDGKPVLASGRQFRVGQFQQLTATIQNG